MQNYFKKRRQCNMSLIFLASLWFGVSPANAEDLREAIQYGLVSKPAEIFIFGNAENTRHARLDNIFNGLKLNRQDNLHALPTAVTNDLALQVVDHYLSVFFREKRLELAKANLRLHRMVFLENPKDTLIATSLAEAEASFLKAQTSLHEAQKKYAKTVGKWPSQLTLPQIPDNTAMPASVGQAIEQGMDNYLFVMSSKADANELEYRNSDLVPFAQKQDNTLIKKRSMVELSKTIRTTWEQWTAVGLRNNTIKKVSNEANALRDTQLEAFKQKKISAKDLLASQKDLYKAQIDLNRSECDELKARYHILDSVGTLMTFINTTPITLTADTEVSSKSAEIVLSDIEPIANPYPDYKPQFHDNLVNDMSMRLNLGSAPTTNITAPSTCFVSAGTFKNKANAVALVNRLKDLGFMAFLKKEAKGSSVLIGPYDYRRNATIGLKRLNDMAHVQGVLIAAK